MKAGDVVINEGATQADVVDLLRRVHSEAWAEITEPNGWSYHTNIGVLAGRAADEIAAQRARADELQAQLDDLYSAAPCSKCGCGVTGDCYGCIAKAAVAERNALRAELARARRVVDAARSWREDETREAKDLLLGRVGKRSVEKSERSLHQLRIALDAWRRGE